MTYDVIVIGSGPAGYVCAIRAAQLGLKVAVVEQRSTHGGTCLNVGCIPSKALLHASEVYRMAKSGMSELGVIAKDITLDLEAMHRHRSSVIENNVKGIAYLFGKNKIDSVQGLGTIISAQQVRVTADDGSVRELTAKSIVVATGSEPISPKNLQIDEHNVVSSTGALTFEEVPRKLIVVGAGVIGLELGSVWERLGSEVTVMEYLPSILPGADLESAKLMQRLLSKQGIKFKLGHSVSTIEPQGEDAEYPLKVVVNKVANGAETSTYADKVLVAVGRKAYTHGLGLTEVGVELDEKGRIVVDGNFSTTVKGIYSIGDVIAGPMLAHKAEEDAVAVAEYIAGGSAHVDYSLVASVVYTNPEIAWVGATEENLKASGTKFTVGKFPFSANGRAKASGHAAGQVKLLADASTDRLLGAHIVGHGAGELIQEAVTAMAFKASAEDLALTCHAHPTMSEAVKEAALDVAGQAIHI